MKNVPEDQLELLSPIRIRSHDSNSELPKLQNQEYLETLRELILDPPKENIAGKYRVLTLDGGGVKGTAILSSLAVIEKITDKPIAKLFDCIVGTSIGGVIAALLTLPSETDPDKPRYSAAELINMLGQVLSDVFPTDCSSTLRKFANLFCCCLNVSKYSPDGIETLFDQYFNQ